MSRGRAGSLLAVPVLLGLLVGAPAPARAGVSSASQSEAYGVLVDLTALSGNVPISSHGPVGHASSSCPDAPGTRTQELAGVGSAAAARADLISGTAGSDCTARTSTATARLVGVDALGAAAQAAVHADAITSTASAACSSSPSGSTRIVNLSIGGTAIPVPTDVPANTVVADPLLSQLGLKVVLNEQKPSTHGNGLVVNGVHISATGSGAVPVGGTVLRGDVILSHVESSATCSAIPVVPAARAVSAPRLVSTGVSPVVGLAALVLLGAALGLRRLRAAA